VKARQQTVGVGLGPKPSFHWVGVLCSLPLQACRLSKKALLVILNQINPKLLDEFGVGTEEAG
jgi:hypothetical protein